MSEQQITRDCQLTIRGQRSGRQRRSVRWARNPEPAFSRGNSNSNSNMLLAQLVSALNWGSLQRAKEFIVLAGRVVLVLDAYRCNQAQDSTRLVIDLLPSNRCLLTAVVRGLSTVQLKSTWLAQKPSSQHLLVAYHSYQCAAHAEVSSRSWS